MRTFQPPAAVPGSGSLPASGSLPGSNGSSNAVAPLVQFFELVHIGDTIQSIVQVYFDKELVRRAFQRYHVLMPDLLIVIWLLFRHRSLTSVTFSMAL